MMGYGFQGLFYHQMKNMIYLERKVSLYRKYLKGYSAIFDAEERAQYKAYVWCTTFYQDLIRQFGSASQNFNKKDFANDPQYRTKKLQEILQLFQKFVKHPYYFMQGQFGKIVLQPKQQILARGKVKSINYGERFNEENAQAMIDVIIQINLRQSYQILFQKYTFEKGLKAIQVEDMETLHIYLVLKNIQMQLETIKQDRIRMIQTGITLVKAIQAPFLYNFIIYVKKVNKNQQKNKRQIKKNQNKIVEQKFMNLNEIVKKSKQQINKQKQQQAQKQYEKYKKQQNKKLYQLHCGCENYLNYYNRIFEHLWYFSQFQYDFENKQKQEKKQIIIPQIYTINGRNYRLYIRSLIPSPAVRYMQENYQ